MFDGDKLVAQWRLRTEAKRTADEYAVWLTQLMHLQGFDRRSIKGAIIASVVPQVNFHLRRLCETYFKTRAAGRRRAGLRARHQGADRPAAGGRRRPPGRRDRGHKRYGGPLIIVDFGTATTFDMVDKDGNFVGGVIAPGIKLSIESFYLMTAPPAAHRGRAAGAA